MSNTESLKGRLIDPNPLEQGIEPKNYAGKKRTAVFLQTHFINEYVKNLYRKISAEAPDSHDVYLMFNCGNDRITVPPEAQDIYDRGRLVLTNTTKFIAMGFPRKSQAVGPDGKAWSMVPGNCDLNIVLFYNEFPTYDYYWGIEYDVHFEGNWGYLFERFEKSNADLLGTTMYIASKTPGKRLNPPMLDSDGNPYDLENAVRGFYPICRMSQRGLELVTKEYHKGWDGHQELLLGTILKNNGMKLEDIGGNGPFVKPDNVNVFYFNNPNTYTMGPGNFVFRPGFKKAWAKQNTLWHPIKPEGNYFIHGKLTPKGWADHVLNAWIKPFVAHAVMRVWFLTLWRKKKDEGR